MTCIIPKLLETNHVFPCLQMFSRRGCWRTQLHNPIYPRLPKIIWLMVDGWWLIWIMIPHRNEHIQDLKPPSRFCWYPKGISPNQFNPFQSPFLAVKSC